MNTGELRFNLKQGEGYMEKEREGDDTLLSAKAVARILGVSVFTVKRACRDRKIAFIKVLGQYRISKVDLEAFIRLNRTPSLQEAMKKIKLPYPREVQRNG